MGYNTNYKLFSSNDEILKSIISLDDDSLAEEIGMEFLKDCGKQYGCIYAKWYDHEEKMKNISSKYKGVLFTLRGEGEETGDLWIKYFLNGKMQHEFARIEFGAFDSTKLM